MIGSSRNNVPKTRGKPFAKGNPGRPRGARNKVSIAAETLLQGEAAALTRKAVELALIGDTTALRLCLERIIPPRRERSICMKMPTVKESKDLPEALGAVVVAISEGKITPGEGLKLVSVIEGQRRAIESENLEQRIATLEKRMGDI